ncbi:BA75_02287T0 [Komagataella pastoris]|uniref:BA75_02287T0 n=1 Tax=Komagataella pastoris TaxID=4922 RepID=A0A1B2JE96_PICPA|nr:BA75_02287T0 [Komagataella pastoris]
MTTNSQESLEIVKPSYSAAAGPTYSKKISKKEDMQRSFAFEWDHPESGAYGSLVDNLGQFFGVLGLVPCCCCANPYKSVQQGTVGLVTKFGELYKAVDPGLVKINILSEKLHIVSVKIRMIEIPKQTCITKDNVNVDLTSVTYFSIVEPEKAVFNIDNVDGALAERTKTTLRQVVGTRNLQDVIERREELAEAIQEVISQTVQNWGVTCHDILIKDLNLPVTVSHALSMAAEAKRIGESKIITAKAEVESAKLMRKAADILASKPAMQIRYLDAMQQMAKSANSKVIFMPGSGEIERQAGDKVLEEAGQGSSLSNRVTDFVSLQESTN